MKKSLGGKGQSLEKLIREGIPCPPSIFISIDNYEKYIQEGILPEREIAQALALPGEKIAVRSSANVEDSGTASFAGQFDTFFVDKTEEAITAAIKQGYNSSGKEHVQRYARQQGIDPSSIKMGMVIQPFIEPLFSGVLFTHDPSDVFSTRGLLNYVQGAGARLVDGKESGKEVCFDRATLEVENSCDFDPRDLLSLSQRIEKIFGCPQDVEFAITKEGKIIILQSRPITAYDFSLEDVCAFELRQIRENASKIKREYGVTTIYSQSNIAELFPEATPLGFGIFEYMFTGDHKTRKGGIQAGRTEFGYSCEEETMTYPLFRLIAGRAYCDLAVDAFCFRIQGVSFAEYAPGFVKRYLKEITQDPQLADYPEGGLFIQRPSRQQLQERVDEDKVEAYYQSYQHFLSNMRGLLATFKDRVGVQLEAIDSFYQQRRDQITSTTPLSTAIRQFEESLEFLRTEASVTFVKVARLGFFSFDQVRGELLSRGVPEEGVDQAANHLIASVGTSYRNETLEIEQVLSLDINREEFMRLYGHIGQLEISKPRYEEQEIPHSNKERDSERRREPFEEVCTELEISPEGTLRQYAQNAADYLALRDTAKCSFLKPLYLAKKAIVRIAELTGMREDIYLLHPQEILSIQDRNDLRDNINRRKAMRRGYSQLSVDSPLINIEEGIRIKEDQGMAERIEGGVFQGKQIVAGTAEGEILKAADSQGYLHKIREGKRQIGVFPSTDPSYGSLDGLIGVVTQYGGRLSHTATVARERGIPYLTGIAIDFIPENGKIKIGKGKVHLEE